MEKTKKHVKFELPYANSNTSAIIRPRFQIDESLLTDAKTFPYTEHKFPKILRIPSLQRKVQRDTRAISTVNYNSSICTTKLSSSIIRSKRSVAAIYPTIDKVNSYLTRSKISSTISPTKGFVKSYGTSYISNVKTPICRTTQISLQLTNWNPLYLQSKTSPPIDITRKFCTICPERHQSFLTTNRPMRLSMTSTDGNDFDGRYLSDKMELLRSNIPRSKILPVTQHHSSFLNITTTYGSQHAWVSLKFQFQIHIKIELLLHFPNYNYDRTKWDDTKERYNVEIFDYIF